MTRIVGTIKSPLGVIPAAKLRFRLDGDIIDTSTDPASLVSKGTIDTATITNGVLDIDIPESATSNTTYFFELFTEFQVEAFFFLDGQGYTGPTHLHTDGKYYTGDSQTTDSVELIRTVEDEENLLNSFHEVVPNVTEVDFTDLVPTGISVGATINSTGAYRVAQLLTSIPTFIQALSAGFNWLDAYNPTTTYTVNDAVSYAGASWVYVSPTDQAGVVPSVSVPDIWAKFAEKGDPGGTGGDDTAYDATGWDGDTNAPSKNAVRDALETLFVKQAVVALLAPLASPALTGTPTCPTPALTDLSTRLANTTFVVNKINELLAPFGTVSFKAEKGGATTITSGVWTPIQNYTAQIYDDTDVLDIATGHFSPATNSYWRLGLHVTLTVASPSSKALFGIRFREVTTNEVYLLDLRHGDIAPDNSIAATCNIHTDALPSTSAWVAEVYLRSFGTITIEPATNEKPTAFWGVKLGDA